MILIKGQEHRKSITDYFERCRKCGKVFYFPHNCNGKTVSCPYCNTQH